MTSLIRFRTSSEDGVVHIPVGFHRIGRGVRALCRCGWMTTPRVSQSRALAAMAREHGCTRPSCAMCGRDRSPMRYTSVDETWLQMHCNLRIETYGPADSEMLVCSTDLDYCHDMQRRKRRAIESLDPFAGPKPEPAVGKVLPFRRPDKSQH